MSCASKDIFKNAPCLMYKHSSWRYRLGNEMVKSTKKYRVQSTEPFNKIKSPQPVSYMTLCLIWPRSIRCPFFETIISPTFKKIKRFQTTNTDVFFRNLDPHSSRLNRKRVVISKKKWFVAGICLIWKLMGYTNDHSPDAPIIPTF